MGSDEMERVGGIIDIFYDCFSFEAMLPVGERNVYLVIDLLLPVLGRGGDGEEQ